jgi:tetratricopeptide (TPR) repeat protein
MSVTAIAQLAFLPSWNDKPKPDDSPSSFPIFVLNIMLGDRSVLEVWRVTALKRPFVVESSFAKSWRIRMQRSLACLRAPTARTWLSGTVLLLALTGSGLGRAQQAPQTDDPDSMAVRVQGSDARDAGDVNKAAELYHKALDIASAKHNEIAQGRTLCFLGRLDYNRKDYAAASHELARAAILLEKGNQADLLPGTLFFLAHASEKLGDYAAARNAYERTLSLASGKDKALTLASLAMTCQELGDDACAMNRATEAAEAYRALGDPNSQANALALRGTVESASGRYEQSLATHREIVDLLAPLAEAPQEPAPVYEREADALSVEGQDLISLGRPSEALEAIALARSIQQKHGMKAAEASMDIALATMFAARFDHARALTYYRQAQELAIDLKDSDRQAESLVGAGQQEIYLNHTGFAMRDLSAAIDLAHAAFDRELEATAHSILANLLTGDEARAALEQSVALWKEIADGGLTGGGFRATHVANPYGSNLRKLAIAYAKANNSEGVSSCLAELKRLAAQPNLFPAARILLLDQASLAARLQSNAVAALEFDKSAMAIAEQIGDDTFVAGVLTDEADIHAAQGKSEQALAEYDRATTLWDRLRDRSAIAELQSGESNVGASAYAGAVELNMHTGRFVQAFDLTERARARAVLNQMQQGSPLPADASSPLVARETALRGEIATLDTGLRDIPAGKVDAETRGKLITRRRDYDELVLRLKIEAPRDAAAIGVDAGSLKELQPLIAPNVTLISYFVARTKVFAFVVTRSSFAAHELPIDVDALNNAVRASVNGLQPDKAQLLYSALIAPLRTELKTQLVAILPHGALNRLSFAALTADGHTYFADEHALYYLPSASFLKVLGRELRAQHPAMLAVSNDNPGAEFGDIPQTRPEAQAVAAIFGTKAIDEATAVEFRKRAPDADYIHVAAHAELIPENPEFSRLVLKPSGDDGGFLTIADIRILHLQRADLVTLSACDTAKGAGAIGDDFPSLNRAFLIAGARSVVATLWAVNDEVSKNLMTAFYTELRNGKSKAAALTIAQRSAREAKPESKDWAAFVLTGRPGGEQ